MKILWLYSWYSNLKTHNRTSVVWSHSPAWNVPLCGHHLVSISVFSRHTCAPVICTAASLWQWRRSSSPQTVPEEDEGGSSAVPQRQDKRPQILREVWRTAPATLFCQPIIIERERGFRSSVAERDTRSSPWPPTLWLGTSSRNLRSEEQPSGAWNNQACSAPTIMGWCCCDCRYMRNKSLGDTGDALGDGGPVLVPAQGNQLQNLRHTLDAIQLPHSGLLHSPPAFSCSGCLSGSRLQTWTRWTGASWQLSSDEDSTSVIFFFLTR